MIKKSGVKFKLSDFFPDFGYRNDYYSFFRIDKLSKSGEYSPYVRYLGTDVINYIINLN